MIGLGSRKFAGISPCLKLYLKIDDHGRKNTQVDSLVSRPTTIERDRSLRFARRFVGVILFYYFFFSRCPNELESDSTREGGL